MAYVAGAVSGTSLSQRNIVLFASWNGIFDGGEYAVVGDE